MRAFLVLILLTLPIATCQVSAQTLPSSTHGRHLYVAFSVNPGWADMNYYRAPNFFRSKLFLKRGRGVNLHFSIGGKHLGFQMDYFSNLHAIDISKTISENTYIKTIAANPNRIQMNGLLIGPYASVQFGYKQKFQLVLEPSIGMVAFKLPQISIEYTTAGFSVTGGDDTSLTNRLTYSIGAEFRYFIWKPIAVGAFVRTYSFNTGDLEGIKSTQFGFSISCRIEQ